MRVALATDPGTPGWPNEDFAAVAPGAAVLLDGCTTTPRGADTGCVHGVAWYARTLGTAFLAAITADPPGPLDAALAGAITEVRSGHEAVCDLANPRTPAATVTAVRAGPAGFETLALSDSSIVADYGDGRDPVVLTDTHRAASADPDAARQAHTAVLPVEGLHGIALLSDGATRITEVYRLIGWPDLVTVIRGRGRPGSSARSGPRRPATRMGSAGPGPRARTTPPPSTGRSRGTCAHEPGRPGFRARIQPRFRAWTQPRSWFHPASVGRRPRRARRCAGPGRRESWHIRGSSPRLRNFGDRSNSRIRAFQAGRLGKIEAIPG